MHIQRAIRLMRKVYVFAGGLCNASLNAIFDRFLGLTELFLLLTARAFWRLRRIFCGLANLLDRRIFFHVKSTSKTQESPVSWSIRNAAKPASPRVTTLISYRG